MSMLASGPDSRRLNPEPCRLTQSEKEHASGQRGFAIWIYGLSGAGKSTLAASLERELHRQGRVTVMLDGDDLRGGLNRGLGFSDTDRTENLRRAAEVAKLLVRSGLVVIAAFITPRREHRALVSTIVGAADLALVHASAPFAVCARRDPKGLYAQAAADVLRQFTGRDSAFEPPLDEAGLTLDTSAESVAESTARLVAYVTPRLVPPHA
ncbi:MAG TPA: adenylyl-sulfate kinase [Lacunisphaera sp.]|nr:adenylyl-sulfate kinase [Lacunisphaera sp.]